MDQGTLPLAPQEPKRLVEMEPEDFVKLYEGHPGVQPRSKGWAWIIGDSAEACPMCLLAASRFSSADPIRGIREIIASKLRGGDSYSLVVAKILGEHQSTVFCFVAGFDGHTAMPGIFPHSDEARKREDRAAYELGGRTRQAMDRVTVVG